MIKTFINAALAAGADIMEIYATDFNVEDKEDGSPVTLADQRAEAIIVKILGQECPQLPVVGEESVAAGRIPQIGSRFAIVDPIDGTKEFIKRNGEFTVNIGLVEDGEVVAGVVFAPALGDLYWGTLEDGAFKARVENGHLTDERPIRCRAAGEGSLTVVASRSHRTERTEAFLEKLPDVSVISAGSSLKFCRVAEGEADLYPRFGRTMEWDTAAGQAVLRAAGGQTLVEGGSPLRYNKQGTTPEERFENPFFLAVGDEQIISRFRLKSGW